MNSTEQRWADAEALLNNTPDDAARRRIRQRRTRMWLFIVGVLVACCVIAYAVGYLTGAFDGSAPQPSRPLWATTVGLALNAAGLVLVVLAIVRMVRAGQWGRQWKAPAFALTWREQRRLRRQVLGKEPVPLEHVRIARDVAIRITQLNSLFLLYAGLMTQQTGLAFGSPSRWRLGFLVFMAALYLVVAVRIQRDSRRASDFLDRHPEPVSP